MLLECRGNFFKALNGKMLWAVCVCSVCVLVCERTHLPELVFGGKRAVFMR